MDWRCPSRRCPAPSRGLARRGPGLLRRFDPRLAEGSIPIEPPSIAASSVRMSPNMFSVTITSKSLRAADQAHRAGVDADLLHLRCLGTPCATRSRPRATAARSPARSPYRPRRASCVAPAPARSRCAAHARSPPRCRPGIDRRGARRRFPDLLGLAEVEAAGQLAHDDHIHATQRFALERGALASAGIVLTGRTLAKSSSSLRSR